MYGLSGLFGGVRLCGDVHVLPADRGIVDGNGRSAETAAEGNLWLPTKPASAQDRLYLRDMNRPRATRHAADAPPSEALQRLEEVFAHCQDELLGLLYYLLGNAEDARDALQDTFIKCWRRRENLTEIDNLRAWVFQVALNAGRDMRTTAWRRRRRPLEQQAQLVTKEQGPENNAIDREQLAMVRQALVQLRPEEQEVFLLRQNGQMTYDQIATSIDIPVGTVKTRMRLALTKLRGSLTNTGTEAKDEG